MDKIVCIIPARGGSKRIPRKNILPLNGTPLISYTIEAAKAAACFDEIIVSSDDDEILDIAKSSQVSIDRRPQEMSGDKITKSEVVHEYLLRNDNHKNFDHVATMLPTCPFRSASDVKSAVELYRSKGPGALVGVVRYEFPPQLALVKNADHVTMTDPKAYLSPRGQTIEARYHPNGAIYIVEINQFIKSKTFFHNEMLAYEMSPESSFDIDYPYQFEIAESFMKQRETERR